MARRFGCDPLEEGRHALAGETPALQDLLAEPRPPPHGVAQIAERAGGQLHLLSCACAAANPGVEHGEAERAPDRLHEVALLHIRRLVGDEAASSSGAWARSIR